MRAVSRYVLAGVSLLALDAWARLCWRVRHPFASYDDYVH